MPRLTSVRRGYSRVLGVALEPCLVKAVQLGPLVGGELNVGLVVELAALCDEGDALALADVLDVLGEQGAVVDAAANDPVGHLECGVRGQAHGRHASS